MANWSDASKIDRLWKSLFGKGRTSPGKQFFEEGIATAYDMHAKDIYADSILPVPPAEDTAQIKKVTVVMTQDRTVSGNRAWVALPSWSANWSSGSGDLSQIMRDFISPKYGPGYTVVLKKGNGVVIPELSNLNWIFDYKAGILLFENDPGQDGNTPISSVSITGYRYVGRFVTDIEKAATGSVVGDTILIKAAGKVTQVNAPDSTTHLLYFQQSPPGAASNIAGQLQASVEIKGAVALVTGMNYTNINGITVFHSTHVEELPVTQDILDIVRASFGGVV